MPAYVAWFFAGLFLVNAIPHFVSGTMGRPFQSPFAKPPGKGLSSSVTNVAWGALNLFIAYCLLAHFGDFDVRSWAHFGTVFAAFAVGGAWLGRNFGHLHGGNTPTAKQD